MNVVFRQSADVNAPRQIPRADPRPAGDSQRPVFPPVRLFIWCITVATCIEATAYMVQLSLLSHRYIFCSLPSAYRNVQCFLIIVYLNAALTPATCIEETAYMFLLYLCLSISRDVRMSNESTYILAMLHCASCMHWGDSIQGVAVYLSPCLLILLCICGSCENFKSRICIRFVFVFNRLFFLMYPIPSSLSPSHLSFSYTWLDHLLWTSKTIIILVWLVFGGDVTHHYHYHLLSCQLLNHQPTPPSLTPSCSWKWG